jgi:anti-sigma B factor antagonist
VVRLPAEIDAANAPCIGEELGSAFASGAATVIADMTATIFCAASGAKELLLAHNKAATAGIELRIVMPSADVRRLFELTGLDRVLAIYPSPAA